MSCDRRQRRTLPARFSLRQSVLDIIIRTEWTKMFPGSMRAVCPLNYFHRGPSHACAY